MCRAGDRVMLGRCNGGPAATKAPRVETPPQPAPPKETDLTDLNALLAEAQRREAGGGERIPLRPLTLGSRTATPRAPSTPASKRRNNSRKGSVGSDDVIDVEANKAAQVRRE